MSRFESDPADPRVERSAGTVRGPGLARPRSEPSPPRAPMRVEPDPSAPDRSSPHAEAEAGSGADRDRSAAWLAVGISWIGILAVAWGVAWPSPPPEGGDDAGATIPAISMVDELGGRITLALCQAVEPEDRLAVIEMSGLGADAMPRFERPGEPVETATGDRDRDQAARRRVAVGLAMAVLVGEAVGGEEGLEWLPAREAVESIATPQHDWLAMRAAVEESLEARRDGVDAPPPSEELRAMLASQLGWFGEVLQLWEGDAARRKAFEVNLGVLLRMLLVALLWFVGFGLAGFGLMLALIVAVAMGRIRPRVVPLGARAGSGRAMPGAAWWLGFLAGVPAAAAAGWWLLGGIGAALAIACAAVALVAAWPVSADRAMKQGGGPLGGIYAETFLIWILLFVGLQVLTEALLGARTIFESVLVMIASLSALAWPRLRGIPFAQVREEIGLVWGRSWWKPPFEGLATYAIALPMIVLGVAIAAVLTGLLGPGPPPSHPIQEEIANASAGGVLMLLLLAAVVVPPIEEIMFRGVLYRHLRELFGGAGALVGFASAAMASSLLFAALHPQGLGFVPILAALAVAFCIARELTGSVVPSIVAHGVSNAAVVLLNAVLFGI